MASLVQSQVDSAPCAEESAETVHQYVLDYCLGLLEKATFVTPDLTDPGSDRITFIALNQEQATASRAVGAEYKNWLDGYVKRSPFLSPCDINLLRANQQEIDSYINMKRRGQDTPIDMYKDFFRAELTDLLKQQKLLCGMADNASSAKNMSRKRRWWSSTPLTIGIEEEYQIVSTDSFELTHDVDKILSTDDFSQFGREVYKSQIEVKTEICNTVRDVAACLRDRREKLQHMLPDGLTVLSAGTHPFSVWNVQRANETARTKLFMHDMQDVVRRLVTFGLHVHIGVEDRELAIEIMSAARRYLPLLLAVTGSSPFWEGRLTGLSSYRSVVFAALPRTGIPPLFADLHEYQSYVDLLAKANSFDGAGAVDARKIWWDVRLHPDYPTIEFRICDACTRMEDAVCVAAICQALVAKLAKLYHEGYEVRKQPKQVVDENKWRAVRYGYRARFIDDLSRREVTARYFGFQLLDFLADVLLELGSESEARHILRIIDNGSSASDQVK